MRSTRRVRITNVEVSDDGCQCTIQNRRRIMTTHIVCIVVSAPQHQSLSEDFCFAHRPSVCCPAASQRVLHLPHRAHAASIGISVSHNRQIVFNAHADTSAKWNRTCFGKKTASYWFDWTPSQGWSIAIVGRLSEAESICDSERLVLKCPMLQRSVWLSRLNSQQLPTVPLRPR